MAATALAGAAVYAVRRSEEVAPVPPAPSAPAKPVAAPPTPAQPKAESRTASSATAASRRFELLFPVLSGELMTTSSPSLADLDGDGALDIVFGTGVQRMQPYREPAVSGYVVAVSGATNQILWQSPNPRDAFTTPRLVRIDGDAVLDVVMGGREGALSAFSGVDGRLLWRVPPESIAKTPFPYCVFTPAPIGDRNGDGTTELLVAYGGDDTRAAHSPRDPGYLAIISGADGRVLSAVQTPDGAETYASPVVYERADSRPWVVFGTGGETQSGTAYRAPVDSLLDGTFARSVERLLEPGASKGVIAPATLVELTGDGELDIVLSTFDGRLAVIAGHSGAVLWQHDARDEESYHPPAIVRIAAEGQLGMFLSRGLGTFPRYTGTVHRLLDATDGRVLYEYRDDLWPAGAPLGVDLDEDGIDEALFFSMRMSSGRGSRIHVLDYPRNELVRHELTSSLASTPTIADPRHTGRLELIALSFTDFAIEKAEQRPLRWQLLRLTLDARPPASPTWPAYMGPDHNGIYAPR